MARRNQSKIIFPPIPAELMELCDDQGHSRYHRHLIETPTGAFDEIDEPREARHRELVMSTAARRASDSSISNEQSNNRA